MPLQFKNIAVGNLQDDVIGNNYAANKAVYILNLNNTLAQIFSDEAGTIPIVQDGVNNATNSKGVFGFWVEAGDYFVQVGANKYRVSITGADYFNNRIDETVDLIVDAVAGRGAYYPVGSFEDGFTYTDINQVGTFGGTDYYIYTGGLTNLPHNVPAGTVPSAPDYQQVTFNDANNVINNDGTTAQETYDQVKSLGIINIANYVSDDSADSASICNALANQARVENKKLYCPPTQNLRFESEVDFRFLTLEIESIITGPSNTTLVRLGGVSVDRRNPPQSIRRIDWDDPNAWQTATNPQIVITGAVGQHINIDTADYIRIHAYGDSTTNPNERATAYSRFDHIFVRKYELLGGDGSGAGLDGWINENEINLRSCFLFTIPESAYSHNNNVINGGTFETGGGNPSNVVIDIAKADSNHFKNCRMEGTPIIKFGAGSSNNTVEYSWLSVVPNSAIDLQDNGEWNTVYNTSNSARPHTNLCNIDYSNVGDVDDDGHNEIVGVSNLEVNGKTVSANSFTKIYESEMISVETMPEFGCTLQGVVLGGIRANITAYDENLNVIGASTESDYVILGVGTASFQSGLTAYPSTNTNKGVVAWLTRVGADKCRYVRFNVYTGGDGVDFKKLNVWCRASTDYLYCGDKLNSKSLVMPTPNKAKSITDRVYIPFVASQTVNAQSTKEIVFNVNVGLVKNTPVSVSRDADRPNLGVVFDASVTGTDEITVYATNVTTSPILLDSGTRLRLRFGRNYVLIPIA